MRVRDKIFAFPRETQVTLKADPDERLSLLADPRFFYRPASAQGAESACAEAALRGQGPTGPRSPS